MTAQPNSPLSAFTVLIESILPYIHYSSDEQALKDVKGLRDFVNGLSPDTEDEGVQEEPEVPVDEAKVEGEKQPPPEPKKEHQWEYFDTNYKPFRVRPYIPGEDLTGISAIGDVSSCGGYICHYLNSPKHIWFARKDAYDQYKKQNMASTRYYAHVDDLQKIHVLRDGTLINNHGVVLIEDHYIKVDAGEVERKKAIYEQERPL